MTDCLKPLLAPLVLTLVFLPSIPINQPRNFWSPPFIAHLVPPSFPPSPRQISFCRQLSQSLSRSSACKVCFLLGMYLEVFPQPLTGLEDPTSTLLVRASGRMVLMQMSLESGPDRE